MQTAGRIQTTPDYKQRGESRRVGENESDVLRGLRELLQNSSRMGQSRTLCVYDGGFKWTDCREM